MSDSPWGPYVRPDPDHPGWLVWQFGENEQNRFGREVMGRMILRPEDGGAVRLRMFPQDKHRNPMGMIHGGMILSLIDISLFVSWRLNTETELHGAVTLELTNHFISAGNPELPLDAVTSVVRETGRLVFLSGKTEQDGEVVSSFTGIVRKASR